MNDYEKLFHVEYDKEGVLKNIDVSSDDLYVGEDAIPEAFDALRDFLLPYYNSLTGDQADDTVWDAILNRAFPGLFLGEDVDWLEITRKTAEVDQCEYLW